MSDKYAMQMLVWADPNPDREPWATCATARSPFLLTTDHHFEIPTTLRIVNQWTGRVFTRWTTTP